MVSLLPIFRHKISHAFFYRSHVCYIPTPSQPPLFDRNNNIWLRVKTTKLLVRIHTLFPSHLLHPLVLILSCHPHPRSMRSGLLTAARIKTTVFCSAANGTHVFEKPAAPIFRADYADTARSLEKLVLIYVATRCIPEGFQSEFRTNPGPHFFEMCCSAIQLTHAEGNTNTLSPLSVQFMHFV